MRDVADAEQSVQTLVAIAATADEPVAVGEPDEDADEPEPLAPLSAMRTGLVDELFTSFSPDLTTPIDLETLKSAGKVENGPAKENLLVGLVAMDANGDGMVEHAEMLYYFQFIGQALTDDEFQMTLSELRDKAEESKALKVAVEQAA